MDKGLDAGKCCSTCLAVGPWEGSRVLAAACDRCKDVTGRRDGVRAPLACRGLALPRVSLLLPLLLLLRGFSWWFQKGFCPSWLAGGVGETLWDKIHGPALWDVFLDSQNPSHPNPSYPMGHQPYIPLLPVSHGIPTFSSLSSLYPMRQDLSC